MTLIDELLCPLCRCLIIEEEDKGELIILWHAKGVKKENGTLGSRWCEIPKSMLVDSEVEDGSQSEKTN